MTRFAMILLVPLLAGCAGDPMRYVPRLSEADVAGAEGQAAIAPDPAAQEVVQDAPPQRTGFLARLLEPRPAPTADVTAEPAVATETAEDGTAVPAEPAVAPVGRSGGLLGFLRSAADDARAAEAGTEQLASATAAAPRAPDASGLQTVAFGTTLPYGVLARVCDVPRRQLGTRVDRYPDGGNTYALYDPQPGNTAAHTYYLTGFNDGCARQFTAALAVFGAPQVHESLRYGLPSQVQPYSTTDDAYERLKSRICGVGRGQPCGSAMSRLARTTAFVSVYEQFGSNSLWKTILLHDGEVIETDILGD